MFSFNLIVSACVIVQLVSGAAIPMWEYLSKDEKMSYLYSMFANQVEEYCEFSEMRNCNQVLLKYGLRKLKDIPEDHLDTMDPYQRGANSIIWDSMMQGHEMMRTTRKPKTTTSTTAKPNSYEDQSFGEDFDYNGEASAKIESFAPTNGFIESKRKQQQPPIRKIITGIPEYRYPIKTNQQQQQQEQPSYEIITFRREYKKAPLDGPMVVKVHPDGTPVDERRIIVEDEDLKHYKLLQQGLPTFQ